MPIRAKKNHPALKHAGYSATSILPGEDAAEFEKLHRNLIAELVPNGVLEDDIVATMARLVWRKQNLVTFRVAKLARGRYAKIESEKVPQDDEELYFLTEEDLAEREAGIQAAEAQARKELGEDYELVEVGKIATIPGLMKDLEVQDRLDSMIDRCLKRLLYVRGLKSISSGSSAAHPKLIAGPSRAV
jgi:hypothetical protein